MKNLNVGLIGYGFMGRAHSNAYRQVNQFFRLDHRPVLKAICARKADQAATFAENWGYESVETDWRKLVEREDIDLIDICSPNNTHLDIAVAAAEAGKMVLCEKPLAMNADEGAKMVEAVAKAGVANMVWFNYRRVPAVSLAKQIVEEGRIGPPFHYRAQYLQDWTIAEDVPQGGATLWRLDIDVAGSGVTGDLLAHSIDTAIWLNGPIVAVSAATETFVKERVHQETGKKQPVRIDDAVMVLARFANGSMGTFESTRYARGRKNYQTFELNGTDGSIFFDLEDAHRLEYYEYRKPGMKEKEPSHLAGWRSIHVTNPEHPYMDKWWVPGCTIGYEHTFINALADFLRGVEEGTPAMPDFADALRTQLVCDAILRSAKSGRWEEVPSGE
ncbi:MAG: Gfo/Idh/MocA family oxidoreductase [Gaiellaceae bacterium]|jgi:predicted dehydrogenase